MNSFKFHENKQHGTPDFPFEYHLINANHPRYQMPFHWHREWELIHIIEGTFMAHTDNEVYTAHAGDILLVRDGMLHGGTPEDCVYECFLFDLHGLFRNLDMVKKHLRPFYRGQFLPEIYYPKGSVPEILNCVNAMSDACQKENPESLSQNPLELIVISAISHLFANILQKDTYTTNKEKPLDKSSKIDLIKTVLEYIELHYTSAITLDDLAQAANMNPRYFCKFFRSITHQTPIDYVNMCRIEKAAQMLQSTRLPVTDICMECGFNDSSNFIKVFRKYKNMTPMQYRKEL